jgi:hypothetical protein
VTDLAIPSPPAPHPAVETAYLAPEAVLYDERTARVYRLNPSASAVWMLLDGTGDVEAISAEIGEIFDVPVATVRGDVAAAIEQFAAQGLLRTGDEPSAAGSGPMIDVPDSVRPMLTSPPVDGEVAVRVALFTRAGRAVLAHLADSVDLDRAHLAHAGVVEVPIQWCFVAPGGDTVSAGNLRWPLAGAMVAGTTDLDEARRRLWPLGHGNRAGWERLLAADGWVMTVDGDTLEALERLLA